MSLRTKTWKQEWPHLTIILKDPRGVIVFPILITLGSVGLEVLFPKEDALCQGVQLSLIAYVTC